MTFQEYLACELAIRRPDLKFAAQEIVERYRDEIYAHGDPTSWFDEDVKGICLSTQAVALVDVLRMAEEEKARA